ncbi:hypothetical protein B0A52_02830 [Exophiala mesophila]|uniref:Major facilitator superfamily (MFS) profile domain-containing protein n=1 Tax=Exophiala mesophila TaxID=212818 RepID=A0A438NE06_EXOME|nr:hypothetical protein B0A52_02830 [Exophiala mesophila]
MTAPVSNVKDDVDHLEMMDKEIGATIEPRQAGDELAPSPQQVAFDKKMLLKLDLILVPVISMLYLLVFVDRVNIGNARVAGLQRDLRLTDLQYQTAVTVTYVLYIAAELPSNLLLKKLGPKVVLSGLCFLWGTVTTLQCLVNNYSGLLAARLMLGLAEGGLFPGINLYLSMFYQREELQLRIAMFYSFAAFSGAFSGLLAAAIAKMHGIGGLSGWQWIFCLEGIFTVLFAPVAYYLLPNTPHQVRLFTEEQADRCAQRLRLDAAYLETETEKVTLRGVLSVYKSIHLWPMFVIMFCGGTTVFGLAFFMPSIVLGMGYSPVRTQLMTVPPFAVAFVVCLGTAYLADHYRKRGITAMITLFVSLVGILMFYKGRTNAVRYPSLFFLVTGAYANGPCLLAWVPNNTAAHTRRATAIATSFMLTNSGGILNKRKENPLYREKMLRDVQGMTFAQQMEKVVSKDGKGQMADDPD